MDPSETSLKQEIVALREEVKKLRRTVTWSGVIVGALFLGTLILPRFLVIIIGAVLLVVIFPQARRLLAGGLESIGKRLKKPEQTP